MMRSVVLAGMCFLFYSVCCGQTRVEFVVSDLPDLKGKSVGIRGNTPPLSWETSIPLTETERSYSTSINFEDKESAIEFKFVIFSDDSNPEWEQTPNRVLMLNAEPLITSKHRWNIQQTIDPSSLKKLSPDELLADFELIKTLVLDVHPGTYRYNSAAAIEANLSELRQALSQPRKYGEAYLAMGKMMASLKCDHTTVGVYNQGFLINSIIHEQPNKLPFTFKWIGDEMVITRNASNEIRLAAGTVIRSINGTNTSEIKRVLMDYVPSDGATDWKRTYRLQATGYDFRLNAFDVLFPLAFPFDKGEVQIEFLSADGSALQSGTLKTMTREARSEVLESRYEGFPKTRDDMWNFEILDNETALLTLNSFGLSGWKGLTIDYKAYFKDIFRKLKKQKTQNLIIDIRENNGGNDEIAIELLKYLTNKSSQFNREGRSRYLQFPEALKPHVRTWGDNPWYFNLQPSNKTPTTDGYYIFEDDPAEKRRSKKDRFKGNLYLLISEANSSLAYYMAYEFKTLGLGTLVGRTTGGNLNDVNGGQILFLELPNSGIEIDFPIIGQFSKTPQPNTGVNPDVEVFLTKEDIAAGRDPVLETAMGLIKN